MLPNICESISLACNLEAAPSPKWWIFWYRRFSCQPSPSQREKTHTQTRLSSSLSNGWHNIHLPLSPVPSISSILHLYFLCSPHISISISDFCKDVFIYNMSQKNISLLMLIYYSYNSSPELCTSYLTWTLALNFSMKITCCCKEIKSI